MRVAALHPGSAPLVRAEAVDVVERGMNVVEVEMKHRIGAALRPRQGLRFQFLPTPGRQCPDRRLLVAVRHGRREHGR
jgi:hypothetical protein